MQWKAKIESIECFFGHLKQRFKILKKPILFQKKDDIDNTMYTIVAIQNMIGDYKLTVSEEMNNASSSWKVQLNWQQVPSADTDGDARANWDRVMKCLAEAEADDIEQEKKEDEKWICRPVVKKKGLKEDGFLEGCDNDYCWASWMWNGTNGISWL